MRSKAESRAFRDDHGVYGLPGDLAPWDVRFDPASRAHLEGDDSGGARFRVWTEPELKEAMLVVRSAGTASGYPMTPVADTRRFVFWEVMSGPLPRGSEYSFAFRAPNGKGVYLTPAGISNAVERIDRWQLQVPDPSTIPAWSKGAVIYQVFPDRFARSGTEETRSDLDPWGAPPHPRSFQGGDLAGVADRLDYLADLGVDVLYLNPIFTSPSNHRYDTIDYYEVDPSLGGNEALSQLIEKAHLRSIRVILDTSLNHVHPRFFAFADVIERGPDSEYWDWFVVREWPMKVRFRPQSGEAPHLETDWLPGAGEIGLPFEEADDVGAPFEPTYEAWYGVPTMPRVNLANPDARAYMLDVAAHWPREYGVDGWRMDVVRYVDPDFWGDFRRVVKEANPDAYLLCEVMGDASSWLQGDRFDATMNYSFRDLCIRFFARAEIDGEEFLDDAARLWAQYAWNVTLANQNLVSSHDTTRFLTECSGEVWRARLAMVFQMTYPGAPGIYYGDEAGMEGGEEPASRGAFLWGDEHAANQLHATIKELVALRRREPALVEGEWRPVGGEGHLVWFERYLEGRRVVTVINRSDSIAHIEGLNPSTVLWGDGEIRDGVVAVAPRSALLVA